MSQWCHEHDVQIWGYCLTPYRVHLIAVPVDESGLAKAGSEIKKFGSVSPEYPTV